MEARRREPFEREPGEPRLVETAGALPRFDLVRWGPTWAGFFVTLGITAILILLGAAVGLTTIGPGAAPAETSMAAAIWGPVSLIIGLVAGGYIMMRLAAAGGQFVAVAHGALLWAVTLVVGSLFAALGLGALLAGALPGMTGPPPGMPPGAVAPESSTALWGSIIALLLGLGASILGAWAGDQGRRAERVERVTRAAA